MNAACAGDDCTATGGPTKEAAEAWGLKAAEKNGTNFQLWAAAAGVILAGIGAAKQYSMYGKMGDLAAAQQKLVDSQRVRYEKLQDEIVLPNLKQARENLWGYGMPYAKSITAQVVECGIEVCKYVRRKTSSTLAAANTAKIMTAARATARRSVNPRATGACCDNDARLAAAQAALVVGQLAVADRYEDQLELQWTQLLWNKQMGAAQLAQRMGEFSANVAVGAANNLTSIMTGLNNTLQLGNATVAQQQLGLAGQASVFGGLGSLGGVISGQALGSLQGSSIVDRILGNNIVGSGNGELPFVDFSSKDSSPIATEVPGMSL